MKRLIDLTGSAVLLLVAWPVMLVTALLVRVFLGSPVIFSQVRPGLGGKPFTLFKFRSMRDAVDSRGNPLPDEARLTPFGKALRATSLDELPQLWNVLRGDMSFIGPRPLLLQYLPLYTPRQARRHEVRPGLTGLAQARGRNSLSWDEKFELDVTYVETRSLWLDIKIVWWTITAILGRKGINSASAATMEAFTGSQDRLNS
ncbi:MAG: sugar transferase [Hyphomonadaceae bacterium]|jgi:lipopolysaccharide/colanic/teichoic acid biosynthesis glycosyltransferase|nr:sugar transferase [Hyphomonadaceae bacterium]